MPKPLDGRVAVVAGATRGAGRGIARMLGEAGATVYCTGRSSRVQPNLSNHVNAGRPETIEETAEMVTADGGTGIPVRVDHTAEDQVVALFERVASRAEQAGRARHRHDGATGFLEELPRRDTRRGEGVRRGLDLAAHRDRLARREADGASIGRG